MRGASDKLMFLTLSALLTAQLHRVSVAPLIDEGCLDLEDKIFGVRDGAILWRAAGSVRDPRETNPRVHECLTTLVLCLLYLLSCLSN